MNNNFNFSKNVFAGGEQTKIAGNFDPTAMNKDGGRMSVEEVRNRQLGAGNNNQSNFNSQSIPTKSGAFTTNMPVKEGTRVDSQMSNNMQSRMHAMQGLNRNSGFPKGF